MKRFPFLPVFFTVLTIVFVAAVWIRLRSYDDDAPQLQTPSTSMASHESTMATSSTATDAPEDMVIVPADENGNPIETAERPKGQSAREQRYQELLRSAPPESTSTQEPSLLDRVVAPIATALGMNRPKAPQVATAQPAAPAPRPQSAPQQSRHEGMRADDPPQGDPTPEDRSQQPRNEDDPETDTVAPQLMGAQFIPPQVQDDGETMFTVQVTDNLSGVRSVSGVIASPSGALQGFACQREGESDRYLARIKVPRDAAEGVWNVKYLTLADQANNSVHLNQAQGALPPSASFRVVSSGSDSAAPQLKSVWLDRRAMTATEKNIVFVQAEDDRSGISLVSGVFVSPSRQARIGFGCRPGPAGAAGAWECTVSPPACLDCGTWKLEQIQLQDKANNMATFRNENPIVQQITLEITGEKCDAGPPAITNLSLDPPVVSSIEGGTIRVAAVVSDDACGVASLSGQAVPAGGNATQRIHFSFAPSVDGTNFIGSLVVPKHAAKGVWSISWIQALDKGHNLRAYSASDPVIGRVTFRVE